MSLPNSSYNQEITSFGSFLLESGLSKISIKNYLSDLRHFLNFLESNNLTNLEDIYLNITEYSLRYQNSQQEVFTPTNTINRRLASIRRFSTYLKTRYFKDDQPYFRQTDQNRSPANQDSLIASSSSSPTTPTSSSQKIVEQFKRFLKNEKKSHSTIKNYTSDIYHYLSWIAKNTPFNTHHLDQVLAKEQLNNYVEFLKLTQTTTSVINRRQSSVKKLASFCTKEGYIKSNPYEYIAPVTNVPVFGWLKRLTPKPKTDSNAPKTAFAKVYYKYHQLKFTPYLHLAILVLATTAMGILAYNQIIKNARPSSAATSLTPPKRQLSFQGRLFDSFGTPITTTVNVNFKLWDSLSGGSQLYTTGTCSVTPDSDGVFNSLIGDGVCGSEIPMSVFADNRDVFLEVGVGAETLTPRQQIATVGYALNSETLQGYPASAAATINTVPVVDNNGDINIAVSSPSIISTSGNFSIVGQSLSLTTATNSGGDIVLQPDALGSGQILAIGGTTTEDTFRITNANLTSGSLLSGYIGNDVATGSGNLLLLSSGATETAKFRVTADGRTTITTATTSAITAALTVNQNGTGDIFTGSASGVTKFNIGNSGNINTIDGVAHTIDDISGNLTLTSNSNTISLNDNVTFAGTTTLNSQTYTWPASAGSNTYVLQTNGSGTLSWVAQSGGVSYWDQANGTLYPLNSTVDFLLGGQATTSAKFAILNVNSGTPVASISSGLSGVSSFLTADGTLATTNNQTLTIGNSTTGNLVIGTGAKTLSIDSSTWDITGAGVASGLTGLSSSGTVTFSGLTANRMVSTTTGGQLTTSITSANLASSITDETGSGVAVFGTSPTFTTRITINGDASASGTYVLTGASSSINSLNGSNLNFATSVGGDAGLTNRMTLLNSGNLGIGTTTPTAKLDVAGNTNINGTISQGTTAWSAAGVNNLYQSSLYGDARTRNLYIQSFNNGSNNTDTWQIFGGELDSTYTLAAPKFKTWVGYPGFALGKTDTGLMRFVTYQSTGSNWNPASPTDIMTFNSTGNVGIGTTSPGNNKLQVVGNSASIGVDTGLYVTNSANTAIFTHSNTDYRSSIGFESGSGQPFISLHAEHSSTLNTLRNDGTGWKGFAMQYEQDPGSGGAVNFIWNGVSTANANFTSIVNTLRMQANGLVGIGTTGPDAELDILSTTEQLRLTYTDGSVYTSFTTDSAGDLTIAPSGSDLNLTGNLSLSSSYLNFGATSGVSGYGIRNNAGTMEFKNNAGSWTALGSGGASWWDQTSGTIQPYNKTVDLLIGGTATTSAKFAVLNVNSGTPVASISSGLSGNGFFLTADGTLGTTNNQTLNIGNGTTGNISLGTGTKNLIVNSNTWDITGAGVASGFTGISSSGTITFTGLSASSAVYTDGSSNLTSVAPTTGILGFWQRTSGSIAPSFVTDSVNIGGTSTASAIVHLGGTAGERSFFMEPVAIGFNTSITNSGLGGGFTALQVDGDILPGVDNDAYLGRASTAWSRLYLSNGINNSGGTEQISIANRNLTGGQWNATSTFRVGDTTISMPTGIEFYTVGDASISATFTAGGNSRIIGDLTINGNATIGGGTGKLDVGTVDPPYTINGEKYATYFSGMIGVKEEVTGSITTDEYLPNIGYRKTINFNNQIKGSDLWLFAKTTNLKENLNRISVLLTPNSQARTWYDMDINSNTLYVYSSSPSTISYRLTAPRFDSDKWLNTRTAGVTGFVLNDPDNYQINLEENRNYSAQIEKIDGQYALLINSQNKIDISNFSESIIANLTAGIATIQELVVENLNIRTKLISPLADIEKLNVIDATVSGTLTADNIRGKTIDKLNEQLEILDEKYSTASSILASIQERVQNIETNTGNDPLQLSPLASLSASLPESLNVENIYTTDLLANGSIFSKSLSSFDTDLFIQPTGDKPVHILANLLNLYPDGQVVVNGDLLVTGNIFANNIDTRTATISGTLAIGPVTQISTDSSKILSLFNQSGNEIGSVDASGSANFNTLQTNGLVIASQNGFESTVAGTTTSNSTIGIASIATGSSEIFINNSLVNDGTLIYVTPISNTDNQVLFVKSKQTSNGFTIAVPQPVSTTTSFNFWLVQTK